MWALQWLLPVLGAAAAAALELTEEQYYQMPRLFALDDMDECLATPGALYCLGSFTLHADDADGGASALLDRMQEYSVEPHRFNRTQLHRGYCVSSRCGASPLPPARAFERCVSRSASRRHGLRARLLALGHCTPAEARHAQPPYGAPHLAVAVAVALLLALNAAGTLYDLCRDPDTKPNAYLAAWSVVASWRRLTADHERDGDPRLTALAPMQGIRATTLMTVIMAHSVLGHYMFYIYNPEFFEKSHQHLLSMFIRNGTVVVQTFFVLSSFLLAYNVLMMDDADVDADKPADGSRKKAVGLRMLPALILHRFIRIAPTHVLAVGLQATWWERSASGPLWGAMVGAEAEVCRRKWWTHLLFLNNLLYADDVCLLPSWFLAADMQLYVVAAALTLALAGRRRWALRALGALLLLAVAGNFLAAYHYGLQPMVKVISPEMMRAQYVTHASFKWLYAAAWGSLPAALVGVALAFVHHRVQATDYPLRDNKVFCCVYRVFYLVLVAWILSGHWWQHLSAPVAVAAYAALERPVYAIVMAWGMLGMFHGLGCLWRSLCALRVWRALGRLSLGVLLAHWPHSQGQLAVRAQAAPVSVYLIGGHMFSTMFMTYWSALLLYLLVETPAQRFLSLLLFTKKQH